MERILTRWLDIPNLRRLDVYEAHGGYRALRFEELRMTACVAAERVQTSRQPFRLNPMSSRERRIVHLALKDMAGVRTESVGVGEDRQVVIHPANSKPAK
jgi:spoIIIJ-associated protein